MRSRHPARSLRLRAFSIAIALLSFVLCGAPRAAADGGTTPLYNVEIVDAEGLRTRVVGFHRSTGENMFRGFVGAADVEVPYGRVRAVRVQAPKRPGGRPRALLMLRSGREITATFDQREAEQLFQGFTTFGRVRVFFRDIRSLRFLGRTKRTDLPKFGRPTGSVDALVRDSHGVEVEVLGFRRAASENVLPGVRGSMRVDIPLRIIKTIELRRRSKRPGLTGTARLRSGESVAFELPVYNEEIAFRGEAEFGSYRIRLGKVRRLTVHRSTPILRELDPRAAAAGQKVKEGAGTRDAPGASTDDTRSDSERGSNGSAGESESGAKRDPDPKAPDPAAGRDSGAGSEREVGDPERAAGSGSRQEGD